MKVSIVIANPAGNITIFVMNPCPQNAYAEIANKLLAIKEYNAEQVAFNVPALLDGAGKIEMMGGEFCGNATRSFGYLLGCMAGDKPTSVLTEVSGASKALTVEIDYDNNSCKTQLPPLMATDEITFENTSYPIMIFDGIAHIIVAGSAKSAEFVSSLFAAASLKIKSDAYGIMFLDGLDLIPVVYVVSTNSVICESSCGSGSAACSCFLSLGKDDGSYNYKLGQPGGVIEGEATIEKGKVTLCKIGGAVSLTEEITLDI